MRWIGAAAVAALLASTSAKAANEITQTFVFDTTGFSDYAANYPNWPYDDMTRVPVRDLTGSIQLTFDPSLPYAQGTPTYNFNNFTPDESFFFTKPLSDGGRQYFFETFDVSNVVLHHSGDAPPHDFNAQVLCAAGGGCQMIPTSIRNPTPEGTITLVNSSRTDYSPISPFILAELSNQAYSDSPHKVGQFAPLDVALPLCSSCNGFSAAAFRNVDDPKEIVIAVRGTDLSHIPSAATSLIRDASIATGSEGILLDGSIASLTGYVQAVHNTDTAASIVLTGHSLGGALAQIVGKAASLDAITFDAPGSSRSVQALTLENVRSELTGISTIPISLLDPSIITNPITNFRLWGDQVSWVEGQFGATITVDNPIGNSVADQNAAQQWLDYHSLANLIVQLNHLCVNVPQPCRQTDPNLDGVNALNTIIGNIFLTNVPLLASVDAALPSSARDVVNRGANSAKVFAYADVPVIGGKVNNFDPDPAYGYLFSIDQNSPFIASLALPDNAPVASWELQFKDGNGWSTPQYSASYFDFTTAVTDLFFAPLDAQGNPTYNPDPFFLNIAFQENGTVNGRLEALEMNAVPEPLTLSIFATGLAGVFAARRKRPNGAQKAV